MVEFGFKFVDTPGNSGHDADFVASVTKHLPNHESGGGFAVSASDGNDVEMASREVVTESGKDGLEEMIREHKLVVERQFFE